MSPQLSLEAQRRLPAGIASFQRRFGIESPAYTALCLLAGGEEHDTITHDDVCKVFTAYRYRQEWCVYADAVRAAARAGTLPPRVSVLSAPRGVYYGCMMGTIDDIDDPGKLSVDDWVLVLEGLYPHGSWWKESYGTV
ncbi:MAG: hypothetical protein IT564_11370 [Rhodospirillales bacterium]|nr:hypothetical protein [Rhodospirillales bacterium]